MPQRNVAAAGRPSFEADGQHGLRRGDVVAPHDVWDVGQPEHVGQIAGGARMK